MPFFKGYFTTAGLIVAIGAQNAFVLKQGLLKNRVFVTALFCTIVDAFLICLGVGGFGALLTSSAFLMKIAQWGGATFLFWYGFRAFHSIFRSQSFDLHASQGPSLPSLKETLLTLTAVSFLNPHVYLDTVILLGSVGSQYASQGRIFFASGAIVAAFFWFFGLCYGARLLAPLFKKKISWKILDFLVGCMMWGIALSLIL